MLASKAPPQTLVPESEYQKALEELKILKSLIPQVFIDQIKTLKQERDNLSSKVDFLNGQLSQSEKRIEDLKKAHSDGRERQKGYWEGQVKDLNYSLSQVTRQKAKAISENEKLSAENEKLNSEVAELRAELAKELLKVSLLDGMDKKLDAQSDKLDTILSEISNIPALIKAMLDNDCSKEEILSTVEQKVSSIAKRGGRKTKEEKDAEYMQIIAFLNEGLSQKEIGNLLYSHQKESSREVTMSRLINSAQFKELASEYLTVNR